MRISFKAAFIPGQGIVIGGESNEPATPPETSPPKQDPLKGISSEDLARIKRNAEIAKRKIGLPRIPKPPKP